MAHGGHRCFPGFRRTLKQRHRREVTLLQAELLQHLQRQRFGVFLAGAQVQGREHWSSGHEAENRSMHRRGLRLPQAQGLPLGSGSAGAGVDVDAGVGAVGQDTGEKVGHSGAAAGATASGAGGGSSFSTAGR